MDDEWKDWNVLESVRKIRVPGFMTYPEPLDEKAEKLVQDEWGEFVKLLNDDGPGAGYDRLLKLQENLREREKEFSERLQKWEDRETWLRRLKGQYLYLLQKTAGVRELSSTWETRGETDPIEQLDSSVSDTADRPIVEAFVEFDENGRLVEWPDLEEGWKLHSGDGLHDRCTDVSKLCPSIGKSPADVNAHRENTTIRWCFSDEELEQFEIDPENLESPRTAIDMEPSTTWREAILQIQKKEGRIREEKMRPERTVRVLDFRLRILENVIHQFEAFGSVMAAGEMLGGNEIVVREPSHITDPPDDLFEGSGTKDRKKAKRYARHLASLYADLEHEVPEDSWTDLYAMMEATLDVEKQGRSMIDAVRNAFEDHQETEDPETSEHLAKACYYFFDISLS